MSYDGEAQIGGRIASVGQRLMDSSSKAIIRQSLGGLNEVLGGATADVAGSAGSPRVLTPPKAPSQAAFAATVAKEVAKDLVPKPVWYVLAALAALLIAYLILR